MGGTPGSQAGALRSTVSYSFHRRGRLRFTVSYSFHRRGRLRSTISCSVRSLLSRALGDDAIVAEAEQPFPSCNGKGHNALQLVVAGAMGNVHARGQQAEAAGGVDRSARPAFYKGARQ